MYMILDSLTRLLAPILTFTAEEVWGYLPHVKDEALSVHLTSFPEPDQLLMDAALNEKWKTLMAIKGEISKAIELARKAKVVGHPLDAAVYLSAPPKLRATLEENLDNLRTINIISDISLAQPADSFYESGEFEGLKIGVTKAAGTKCQRCWMISTTVGISREDPGVCERCLKNLKD